jgi:hypothetical protein
MIFPKLLPEKINKTNLSSKRPKKSSQIPPHFHAKIDLRKPEQFSILTDERCTKTMLSKDCCIGCM